MTFGCCSRHSFSKAEGFGSALYTVLLFLCCLRAGAQTSKAPDPGPGVVPITGTWQFHTGDDLAWANPALTTQDGRPSP